MHGIWELRWAVQNGHITISYAAKIASLPRYIQEMITEEVEAQISEGKKPRMAAIIHDAVLFMQNARKLSADELMEMYRYEQKIRRNFLRETLDMLSIKPRADYHINNLERSLREWCTSNNKLYAPKKPKQNALPS